MDKIINKNYNSIGHLSFSRLGEGDHYIDEGHERIFTKETRDYKDLIIITEKLDGSNVGIIKKDNKIYAITRSGYLAESSNYKQHVLFNKWVNKHYHYFYNLLKDDMRICGEWMLKTHGTKYNIDNENELFRPFDIIYNEKRLNYLDFLERINYTNGKILYKFLIPVKLLHIGQPIGKNQIEKLLQKIDKESLEQCEGVVIRLERDGKFEMITKYVRQNKIDGLYMKDENEYNYDYTLI